MTRLNLAILALLAPTAFAIPRYANKPSGVPTSVPVGPLSTGASEAPYAQHNSTFVAPLGTGTAPNQLTTVTVVPIPASSGANEVPLSSSGSLIDHHVGGGNTESPLTGSAAAGGCGQATVTVTSANTVTVTVGAAPVGHSGVPSGSPVTSLVASLEASSSPAPFGHGTSKFPIGTETAHGTAPIGLLSTGGSPIAGTAPIKLSTGVPPAKPVPTGSHGHHHASFHRSKTSSPVVISSTPEASVASSHPVPESSISKTPVVPESSSTPAPESSASKAPVVTPVPESSTSRTPVAPEPSITPVPESSTSEAPVVTPVPESSASITPLAPYTPPAPSSTPSPTSASEVATSSSPPPQSSSLTPDLKSYVSTPNTKSHVSTSGGGVTPRGLVYNTAALTDLFSSNAISWAYNWDSQPGGSISPNLNFVPQLWGPIPVHTDHWTDNADKALAGGSTHILGFNEPDLPAQANLSPEAAVEAWITYLEPYAGKAKLGSPAVCNGNDANMGLNWLSSFLGACGDRCTVDFVAIHWYGLASDAGVADFKDHVAKTKAACGGREIWITEFAPSGSPDEQADFLSQILPWLDNTSESGVARYAFYQVDNILASGNSLTKLGDVYAS